MISKTAVSLRTAELRTGIDSLVLEMFFKEGILAGEVRKRGTFLETGTPALTIDELFDFERYLIIMSVSRGVGYYHRRYFDGGKLPKMNVRTRIKRREVFLHKLGEDYPIYVSLRKVRGKTVTDILGKAGRKPIMSRKYVLEAYVLRYFDGVKIKDLIPMYREYYPKLSHPTIRTQLSKHEKARENIIEPILDRIIEMYDLPKKTKLLTVPETAARLNINEETVRRYIGSEFLKGYKEENNMGKFYAVDYSSVRELIVSQIGEEFAKERLLTAPQFARKKGWRYHAWTIIEKKRIPYVSVTPLKEIPTASLTGNQLHDLHQLSRIPQCMLSIYR